MAYFTKVKGGWRAQVEIAGVRKSQTRPTKGEAQSWAAAEETAIRAGSRGQFPSRTLSEAFRRYEKEVSSKKRGGATELLRFRKFERLFPDLAAKVFHEIDEIDIARWRDERLEEISADSVLREAAQYRNVFTVGAREWKWCAAPSPFASVKLPQKPKPRDQRWNWRGLRRMLRHMGYRSGVAPTSVQGQVAYAFLVAQITSMRASEILGLGVDNNDLARRVYTLKSHKTVEKEGTRYVPYTARAARLLRVLDAQARAEGRTRYFTIGAASLDANFRKVRDQLLLDGLRFHDSRADALTRMSRKIDVLTLARISGHRDLRQLQNSYYRETAAEIAARI